MSIVYLDGNFVEEEEAKISVFDRGFLLGDGVYATIQVNEGTPLFLNTHLEQLNRQCLAFHLTMPTLSIEVVEELITRNQAEEGIWRLKVVITGGQSSEMRLPQRSGSVVMLLKPFKPDAFKVLEMGIFPLPLSSCHSNFKSLAHLNRYYVMEDAKQRKLDDCVSITSEGKLLEASFGNLLFFHDGKALTPDPSLPLYFGVTLTTLLELVKEEGYELQMMKLSLNELPKACVAFRTNTMQGIRPIGSIADHTFQRQPVLESFLIEGYKKKIAEYKKQRMRACAAS